MKKHFRLFVLGFCACAKTVTTDEQGNMERAWQVITGIVPGAEKFVSLQFSPESTRSESTMETVPTPTDPVG